MGDLYGPPQFRMNQGSARKWRAALLATDWVFDPSQLSFSDPDGTVYGSPEGVLARIADPNPTRAWDGASYLHDGAQFCLPPRHVAAFKLRGALPEFRSFAHAVWYLDQMAAHFGMDDFVARETKET